MASQIETWKGYINDFVAWVTKEAYPGSGTIESKNKWLAANANAVNNVLAALAGLEHGIKAGQDIDTAAIPEFAGLKLSGVPSTEGYYYPYINTAGSNIEVEWLTESQLRSRVGTGFDKTGQVTLSADTESIIDLSALSYTALTDYEIVVFGRESASGWNAGVNVQYKKEINQVTLRAPVACTAVYFIIKINS